MKTQTHTDNLTHSNTHNKSDLTLFFMHLQTQSFTIFLRFNFIRSASERAAFRRREGQVPVSAKCTKIEIGAIKTTCKRWQKSRRRQHRVNHNEAKVESFQQHRSGNTLQFHMRAAWKGIWLK